MAVSGARITTSASDEEEEGEEEGSITGVVSEQKWKSRAPFSIAAESKSEMGNCLSDLMFISVTELSEEPM